MTLLILILIVLYGSITFFNVKNNTVSSPIMDVTRNININDLNLKVKYISGNMIDEKILSNSDIFVVENGKIISN